MAINSFKSVPRELPPAHSLKKPEINLQGKFITVKEFFCVDTKYEVGDEFDRTNVTTRTLRQLYEQNFISNKKKGAVSRFVKVKGSS